MFRSQLKGHVSLLCYQEVYIRSLKLIQKLKDGDVKSEPVCLRNAYLVKSGPVSLRNVYLCFIPDRVNIRGNISTSTSNPGVESVTANCVSQHCTL